MAPVDLPVPRGILSLRRVGIDAKGTFLGPTTECGISCCLRACDEGSFLLSTVRQATRADGSPTQLPETKSTTGAFLAHKACDHPGMVEGAEPDQQGG